MPVVGAVNGGFILINSIKHIANSLNTRHLLSRINLLFHRLPSSSDTGGSKI
jgi:hypothetical protein